MPSRTESSCSAWRTRLKSRNCFVPGRRTVMRTASPALPLRCCTASMVLMLSASTSPMRMILAGRLHAGLGCGSLFIHRDDRDHTVAQGDGDAHSFAGVALFLPHLLEEGLSHVLAVGSSLSMPSSASFDELVTQVTFFSST